ncbi:unnamed protein product [Adineta steineri]|uniref:C2H2-type domain-containing protein n=1 Tax=Adineta steineri TaxID=433720 RepID=A0A814N2P0_9BILA|nr:unnamed protein product [Adineta steineri]
MELSSMHSPKPNISIDEQQELPSDINNVKIGARTNTSPSINGSRSDVDSPVRSFALIETDSNELDRIIDILRQFFPTTRIVECNNSSSSNPSRTPSRSSLAAAPQQQTSFESNSSLRVPQSNIHRYRSHSQSISDKSSFESDHLQNCSTLSPEIANTHISDQGTSNTNSQIFKGKVKDYLQRRYLEQINEHQTRKDTFTKCHSDDFNCHRLKRDSTAGFVQGFEHISQPEHYHHHAYLNASSIPSTIKAHSFDSSSSLLLQHSVSDTNLCCALSASDTSFIPTQNASIIRSQSKRGLLQRCATIDMEDIPTVTVEDAQMTSSPTSPVINENPEGGKITFSIERPDDDDDDDDNGDNNDEKESLSIPVNNQHERKSRPFRHSNSDQQTKSDLTKMNYHNPNFLVPFRHSFDHQHEKQTSPSNISTMSFASGTSTTLTPYSAASDPGPYQQIWTHTPTNPYNLVNFHFPKSQEHFAANAQGSIAQLSTLTKILCDEPSVFTPITPRFKTETQESNNTRDSSSSSSSVPSCQICRQQTDSRQMYLAHYRTHLENPCEDDKSGILDFNTIDNTCDRPGELRNYSCKICSKRFSRSDMLNRHLRLHSGIRPYRCGMCNTHFSRSDHLSTHLRTHTGEKPYTCPECSYAACRRDMITRHLKVHSKQRSERKNATSSLGSSNES